MNQNNDKNLLDTLKTEFDNLPEEKKDSWIGKTLDFLMNSGIALEIGVKIYRVVTSGKCMDTIDEISTVIGTFTKDKSTHLKKLADNVNIEDVKNYCYSICNCNPITEESKNHALNGVLDSKKKLVDDVVKVSAWTSSVVFCLQIIKLCIVFKDIKLANNVVDSSKAEIPAIETKINDLKKGIDNILKLQNDYQNESDEEEKLEIAKDVNDIIGELQCIYVETVKKIGDIKFKIGNSIERMKVRRSEQLFDGISNAVNFGTNLTQLVKFAELISDPTAGNFTAYFMSDSTLKQLSEQMKLILDLEKQLEDIREALKVAYKWYREIRDKRRKKAHIFCNSHGKNIRCLNCVSSLTENLSLSEDTATTRLNKSSDETDESQQAVMETCRNHGENVRCIKCMHGSGSNANEKKSIVKYGSVHKFK